MNKSLIVIPCRHSSTRLAQKHLIELSNGKTIFQMTYEQCIKTNADKVVIATDNQEIFDRAKLFTQDVVMTDINHPSGTDRVAEVASSMSEYDYIVNVQGDEPLIEPDSINKIIDAITKDSKAVSYSAMTPFISLGEVQNPNNVKVVVDKNNHALYFSRSIIPFNRNINKNSTHQLGYKHLGLYAYKRDFLLKYTKLGPSNLSIVESLEQLRVLEHGYTMGMIEIQEDSIGIDEKEDIERLEKILNS
jgi:3-deoxy-manno-octulosonate cytidylyltransferase (CMP-KDO synthetase)